MKKLWKIIIGIMSICIINTASVSAATSSFYFDLSTYVTDMTLRTAKDGGVDYEKFYYVTPTLIQYDKNFSVTPWRIVTESTRRQVGAAYTINYSAEGTTKRFPYNQSEVVPAGDYYYLIGRLQATGNQHIEGFYCP